VISRRRLHISTLSMKKSKRSSHDCLFCSVRFLNSDRSRLSQIQHKILFLSFVCMRQLRRQLRPREKLYARAKKFEFTHQMTFTPVLPPLASLTTTNLVTVVMSVLGACMRRSSRASPSTWWKDYPRPMSGILVAMTVIKSTLASSGRLAM
jgi:hypothetical protein